MSLENKNVLVTGGAGFIGSRLVEKLVERGANVSVVDVSDFKRLENVITKIKAINCDVSKKEDLVNNLDKNYDYIFHLAALASPGDCIKDPELAFKINVLGTFNIMNLAKDMGVKKIVFPSSAQLYGRYPKYFPIDENHPIDYQDNMYNITKKYGEDILHFYGKQFNLQYVILRLFNTYGPKQDKNYFLPTLITQAMEKNKVELWSPKPTRDFTFVDDTAEAFIKAAESDFIGGPINIGSNIEIKIGDIAKQLSEKMNVEIKYLDKPVIGSMRMKCNNEKALKTIGWSPKVPFETGLEKTIEWFKNKN